MFNQFLTMLKMRLFTFLFILERFHTLFTFRPRSKIANVQLFPVSIVLAQTEPWLTPNARKLLKKTRALNKRRRSCPSAHLEACFRAKRDRVLEMVEECKAAWLEKIDKEIQECDRVLFEVFSQQWPYSS
uniref:Uncharacterized protein n=1 Tax=Schistocephalus solidus TaxID=70667 RepID=A0A0X3PA75_SCHSO